MKLQIIINKEKLLKTTIEKKESTYKDTNQTKSRFFISID